MVVKMALFCKISDFCNLRKYFLKFFLDLNPNGGRPIHNLTVIDEYGDITWNRFRKIYKKIDPNNRGNRLEEDFRVLHRDCFNFGEEGKCRKRKKGKPTVRSFNQV